MGLLSTLLIALQPELRSNSREEPTGQKLTSQSRIQANRAVRDLVSEIVAAYGADKVAGGGAGQTIAILIDTFPRNSDLTEFWSVNGLPVTLSQIDKINVGGGTVPGPPGEKTLDVSWTSGIAPKTNIRVYASGALTFVALDGRSGT